MKRTVFLFVFACMTCIVNAQIGAIARTFRRATPYLAVSAIRAQKQIQEQQRKLTMECCLQTRSLELQSVEPIQLTMLAHSTESFEHVFPLSTKLPQVDNKKPQKMTSGSTNGKDPKKDGCILRPDKSQPVIRDTDGITKPKRESKDSREKENKEKENSSEKKKI